MRKNNKGFSLVELLIALAVSSIVLGALLVLISQAVQSYTKQTAISQLMNEVDLTLNQVGVEIMESKGLYIKYNSSESEDLDGALVGNYSIYVDNINPEKDLDGNANVDKLDKTKLCGYVLGSDNVLYYIDEDGGKSEVCDHVKAFTVKVDKDSFDLDSDNITINKIDKNVRVIVEITIERFNITRTVKRTYRSRNDISSSIYLEALTSEEADGASKTVLLTKHIKPGDKMDDTINTYIFR